MNNRRPVVMDSRRSSIGPMQIGIILACDRPKEVSEGALLEGEIVPTEIIFRNKAGTIVAQVEVRNLTATECIMVVNRFLGERLIEFGFRPTEGPPLVSV